jgi:hypothetical protein
MGSDHYPVTTCLGVEVSTVQYQARPSWKFKNESWGAWSVALQQKGTTPSPDIEVSCANFADNIISASTEVFSQSEAIITSKYNKPWWTPSCAWAVEAKRTAKRILISQPSPTNLIVFGRCEAKVKWEVRGAKQNSWRSCSVTHFATFIL